MKALEFDYALLTYKTRNIGDYIQSIAARRFLPRLDHLVDRDGLGAFAPVRPTKLICNGWFGAAPHNLLFRGPLRPLLISMHINRHEDRSGGGAPLPLADLLRNVPELVRHLAQFAPIGARDRETERLLEELGVGTYFSGCLTLTLERDTKLRRGPRVIVCDVPGEIVERLRAVSRRPVEAVTHMPASMQCDAAYFEHAEELLRRYQTAHFVVTSRLHCALPCIAYGTPVVLLHPHREADRFSGLLDLINVRPWSSHFEAVDVEAPAPNPRNHSPVREALIERVSAYIENAVEPHSIPVDDPLALSRALLRFYAQMASQTRDELEVVRRRVEDLEGSTSWRLTAPLRGLKNWFG